MSKPDDIPQDVWDSAEDQLRGLSYLLSSTEIVARVILAETERCAKIADSWPNLHPILQEEISAAIRTHQSPTPQQGEAA